MNDRRNTPTPDSSSRGPRAGRATRRYRRAPRRIALAAALLTATLLIIAAPSAGERAGDAPAGEEATKVRIAALTIGDHDSARCFNTAFIGEVDRRTNIDIAPELQPVKLGDEALFNHPIAVLAGDAAFEISDRQAEHLATYLNRGGFLLASANCTAPQFDESFRKAIAAVLPEAKLEAVPNDHKLMSTLFEIEKPRVGKEVDTDPLQAITINGRIAVLYSPFGLNDSYGQKAECCCCGATELLNARLINANAVVYATTR